MAKRIIEELIDDIDGKGADQTLRFSYDGVNYEIDLSNNNAAKFRLALQPYCTAGRKVRAIVAAGTRAPGSRVPAARQPRTGPSATEAKERNAAIREWALSKGIDVAERGRIKQEIVDQYDKATARQSETSLVRRLATAVPPQKTASKKTERAAALTG